MNENFDANEQNLDDFSAAFFGQNQQVEDSAEANSEEVSDTVDHSDAPNNEDTQDEADTLDAENEDKPGEEAPKPKKNRFQERIDELTAKARTAERELAELKAKFEQNGKTPPSKETVKEDREPQPDDLNEDGTDKYPNGEFDRKYQADLTKFLFKQEKEEYEKAQSLEKQNKAMQEEQGARMQLWEAKLEPARERYPDFQEKGQELIDSFADLDSNYSVYLTDTLMSMEHGPDVLYYLSTHPDEARAIVDSGALKATIALGRIESKFFGEEDQQKPHVRVSNAPTPPPALNKGSNGVVKKSFDDMSLDEVTAAIYGKRRY